MVGIFVLGIVATPFLFAGWLVNRVFEHRMRVKQIEAGYRSPLALRPSVEAQPERAAQVERRLANLEAIVCDLDFDLAKRVREATGGRAA